MLDGVTVVFGCPQGLPGPEWTVHYWGRGDDEGGQSMRYTYNGPGRKRGRGKAIGTVRLTAGSAPYQPGRCCLYAECCLGAVLYGHNVRTLTLAECRKAFRELERYVAEVMPNLPGPPPPVDTWSVSRCEFSYDWIVPDPNAVVDDTWPVLPGHTRRSAQRIKHPFGGDAWTVSGRGASFKLYNKEAETKKQIAGGEIDRERCRLSDEELMALAAGRLRFEYLAQREALADTILRVSRVPESGDRQAPGHHPDKGLPPERDLPGHLYLWRVAAGGSGTANCGSGNLGGSAGDSGGTRGRGSAGIRLPTGSPICYAGRFTALTAAVSTRTPPLSPVRSSTISACIIRSARPSARWRR